MLESGSLQPALHLIGRYVFHRPPVWSDELAGILFLWLAMLGSVIAFQRGDHMRMTATSACSAPAPAPSST